jgi:hypothetical protein
MKRSRHTEAAALDEAARAVFRTGSLVNTGGHMVEERAGKAFTVFYDKVEYFGCSELDEVLYIKDLWDERAEKLGRLTGRQHRELQESLRVQQISARRAIAAKVECGDKKGVEEALYACSSIVSAWAMDRAVQGCIPVSHKKRVTFTHGGKSYQLHGGDLCNLSWLGAVTGRYKLAGGGVCYFLYTARMLRFEGDLRVI